MILVVGASGHLGRAIAARLLAEGKRVRLMTRNPRALSELAEQGAEVISGDLRDPASLIRACQGIEQVVAAAHAFEGKGINSPQTVDDAGNRHLIDAAKAAGVKHFIFISIAGVSPNAPIDFFRIKYQTEEYLRSSGLGYTIIRPTAFMDLWGPLIGQSIVERGQTTIFGRGDNPVNFVAAADVADLVCLALLERAHDRVIEIGGPEDLTLNQIAGLIEQVSGRRAKQRHVPLPVMRIMSVLMQPINPALGRQIRTGIMMDTANMRFDMSQTLKLFPIQLTRFEDWANGHYRQHSPTAEKELDSLTAANAG